MSSARFHQYIRGLSGTVLSHHNDNFRVGELPSLDGEVEVAKRLCHLRVAILSALVGNELLACLSDTELERLFTETQVLGRNVTVKEDVDTFTNGVRLGNHTVDCGLAVEKADKVTLIAY